MAPFSSNILKLRDTAANEVIRTQADPQMPLWQKTWHNLGSLMLYIRHGIAGGSPGVRINKTRQGQHIQNFIGSTDLSFFSE